MKSIISKVFYKVAPAGGFSRPSLKSQRNYFPQLSYFELLCFINSQLNFFSWTHSFKLTVFFFFRLVEKRGGINALAAKLSLFIYTNKLPATFLFFFLSLIRFIEQIDISQDGVIQDPVLCRRRSMELTFYILIANVEIGQWMHFYVIFILRLGF